MCFQNYLNGFDIYFLYRIFSSYFWLISQHSSCTGDGTVLSSADLFWQCISKLWLEELINAKKKRRVITYWHSTGWNLCEMVQCFGCIKGHPISFAPHAPPSIFVILSKQINLFAVDNFIKDVWYFFWWWLFSFTRWHSRFPIPWWRCNNWRKFGLTNHDTLVFFLLGYLSFFK